MARLGIESAPVEAKYFRRRIRRDDLLGVFKITRAAGEHLSDQEGIAW